MFKYKKEAEYWKNKYEDEAVKVRQRDKFIEKQKETLSSIELETQNTIIKQNEFIIDLKKTATGKGTVVQILDALIDKLIKFDLDSN